MVVNSENECALSNRRRRRRRRRDMNTRRITDVET
jgi:hypothetical protein